MAWRISTLDSAPLLKENSTATHFPHFEIQKNSSTSGCYKGLNEVTHVKHNIRCNWQQYINFINTPHSTCSLGLTFGVLQTFTFIQKTMSDRCEPQRCSESPGASPPLCRAAGPRSVCPAILQEVGLPFLRSRGTAKMFMLCESGLEVSCSLFFFSSVPLAALKVSLAG